MQRATALFVAVVTTIQLSILHNELPTYLANFENWEENHLFESEPAARTTDSKSKPQTEISTMADLNYDLSVVITSNLIPTHPSITFVNQTIASLLLLEELPMDAPIYITIDGIKHTPSKKDRKEAKRDHDHDRRSQYIHRLRNASFYPFTNIHVLDMEIHQHISGSVNQALKYISNKNSSQRFDPSEHFIYLLQHDLYFKQSVPHKQLVQAMREYPELKNIRFRFNRGPNYQESDKQDQRRFPPCPDIENGLSFERNGLPFFATARWSDNNQLSTLQYYQEMIAHIQNTTTNSRLNLPMEFVMMNTAHKHCAEWGQMVLGDRTKRLSYLGHLDGRNTQ
jgi:hypothetical protein